MDTRWHVATDEADWLRQALDHVRSAEARALAGRGAFHIVLAGGGTPRKVYEQLAREPHDWARWHVWFGDERCLPASDPERNSRMAFEAWLSKVPIPPAQIHVIPAELGAAVAAERYARELAGVHAFDLVLLGLGEDGHTASLFPGHDWGEAIDAPPVLAVFDAPKPPAERVSLSARRLNCACVVLFLVAGAGKREAVKAWRGGVALPAAAIRPACGVDVLLDPASAMV
ncbi:MAG: 6-phosphogluconolactonase [Pseudomonadota bacterium]